MDGIVLVKKVYVKYFTALLLFGSNGIVASKISLSSCQIVFLRTLIGSLLLVAIFKLTKKNFTFLRDKRQFLFLTVSGIAMGASWMFLYEAYRQIGVGIASLAYYCGPVIVITLSPLLFKEKLTWGKIVGFTTVMCGMVLVSAQGVQEGGTPWGFICGSMSAVMYAAMVILNKKTVDIKGLENATLQLTSSLLTVAVFVALTGGFEMQITNDDWFPIIILGLINTGIGCYLYFSSIGLLSAQTVAVCGYLEPLSAVALSALILRETMLPLQILGAAMILGGAIFSELIGVRTSSPKINPY